MPVAQVKIKKRFFALVLRKVIVPLGMQGKKDYQEKLFNSFQLSERIPKNNFYRRLRGELDLNFLYKLS